MIDEYHFFLKRKGSFDASVCVTKIPLRHQRKLLDSLNLQTQKSIKRVNNNRIARFNVPGALKSLDDIPVNLYIAWQETIAGTSFMPSRICSYI